MNLPPLSPMQWVQLYYSEPDWMYTGACATWPDTPVSNKTKASRMLKALPPDAEVQMYAGMYSGTPQLTVGRQIPFIYNKCDPNDSLGVLVYKGPVKELLPLLLQYMNMYESALV